MPAARRVCTANAIDEPRGSFVESDVARRVWCHSREERLRRAGHRVRTWLLLLRGGADRGTLRTGKLRCVRV